MFINIRWTGDTRIVITSSCFNFLGQHQKSARWINDDNYIQIQEQIKEYLELIEKEKRDKEYFKFRNEVWKAYQKYLSNKNFVNDCITDLELIPTAENEAVFRFYCGYKLKSNCYGITDRYNISSELFNIWEDLRLGRLKETYNKQLPFNGD